MKIRFSLLILILVLAMAVPSSAVPAEPLNKVFVGSRYDRTVTVLDTTDETVLADAPWPAQPINGAITPDGTRLFLTSYNTNAIYGMDTATYAVTTTIPLEGCDQRGIAITPNGQTMYVADNCLRRVSILDLTQNIAVGRVPLPDALRCHPEQIALSPDGGRLYIGCNGPDRIVVVDTATNRPIQQRLAGGTIAGILVSFDGARLYVAASGARTIAVLDPETLALQQQIPVAGAGFLILTPDGSKLYSLGYTTDRVSVVDTSTLTEVAVLDVPGLPLRGAASEDGQKVYVGTSDGNLSVIDTATDTITTNIFLGGRLEAVVTKPTP